ncbi:MAG: hypothetical protein GY679_00400 [Mycoplasma sp.]|nr:hypothetical protein [Mycoplasma sp.]
MQGMTMWIILGVLITIVIGFLFFSAILDKKKRKQEKEILKQQKQEESMAKGKVSILIGILVNLNNKKLEKFKPSIGKEKMSTINNYAKKELYRIKKDNLYKFISKDPKILENFLIISKTKSNNWIKQCPKSIKFFGDLEKQTEKESFKAEFEVFKKNQINRLKKEYKYDNSK